MGCTASVETVGGGQEVSAAQQNSQLERILRESRAKKKSQVKLLLLGAGESGKSTVLKQLRLLHKGGFSEAERRQYRNVLWADTVGSMQTLVMQARRLGIPLDCDRPTSPLYACKKKVLGYKPLEDIDFGGGVLKDFVVKYSGRSAQRRKLESTGKADAGWVDADNDDDDNDDDDDSLVSDEEKGAELAAVTHQRRKVQQSPPPNYTRKEVAEAVQKLWAEDPGIQNCFNKSNRFQLEGSAAYLFEHALDFADDSYRCSDEDILKGRIKTTGITETDLDINGMKFKILDAGGQRSERKKWMHYFHDITCTCFVLAVSEYDQVLFEDERVNRMLEAIMLFDSLCNSKWFRDTPFILFLNKTDLFEKKVKRSPVRQYFPDYEGKSNDPEEVLQYFERLFLSLNRTNKPIYVHRTCATDTESMKFVLTAVTDMLIQQNLKTSGIF